MLAVICRMVWLFWPVSLAAMSRVGRYLLYGVAALARVGGRYQPCPGGHACLSAVMPASAACQNPWRRANTLHTFARRRTQGAGARLMGESRGTFLRGDH